MSSTTNRRSTEHLKLLFEIYSLIPTTRKVTAKEIQQTLDDKGITRTKRTVQRSLDSLLTYFDIEQDTRSQPYGYRRKASSKPIWSARDHMLFGWAESYLKALLPEEYRSVIEESFSPLYGRKTHKQLIDVRLPAEQQANSPSKVVFEILCSAIFYRREVKLTLLHQESDDFVHPLGFVSEFARIYLIYRFKGRINHVDVNHILAATLTTFEFKYPADFSLNNVTLA